jgi:hypothetical protein
MNPIDPSVESIEAHGFRTKQRRSRLSIVKSFDAWLKAQDVTFDITFDRFCADLYRSVAALVAN